MCGIAGYVGDLSEDAVRAALERMAARQRHRGPDDEGIHVTTSHVGRVGLAAQRLAIQDLSRAGHQPMVEPTTRNALVFNGEIYNFRELRAELERSGERFTSGSDTEVVLLGYRVWGIEALLARLRGMFAIAIWDATREELVLARDRLGVKPLYHSALAGGGLVFASEVRSLLASGLVPRAIDDAAIAGYLALGAVQEPRTIIANVTALRPGTYAVVGRDGIRSASYWSLAERFTRPRITGSRDDVVARLRDLLLESVRLRLISDAPMGIFLSGGIDSTAIVALAREAKGERLRSVSVVFPDEADAERGYAREVARAFETDHVEIEISSSDALRFIPSALEAMDQPTFDGVNTYIVALEAQRSGLTVALSGIGGDELFGGYESFRRAGWLASLTRLPAPARAAAAAVLGPLPDTDRVRKLARWLRQADVDASPTLLLRELFSPGARGRLGHAGPAISEIEPTPRGLSSFDTVSYFELEHYMRNVLLHDTDVMGMASSLEIREPLLDHVLVEYVASLPEDVKTAGRPKALLVDAVIDLIPPRIARRRKRGFLLPFDRWLRGPLRPTVAAALTDAGPSANGAVLRRDEVAETWRRYEAGRTSWTRPWALYVLATWARRHLE